MNKFFYLFFSILSMILMTTACNTFHKQQNPSSKMSALTGTWNGRGNALGKGDSYRGGQFKLTIKKDGTFSLEDTEQPCTILTGTVSLDEGQQITLWTEEKNAGSLPAGWENLHSHDHLFYETPEPGLLILTYEDISYLFIEETEKNTWNNQEDSDLFTAGPLLRLSETDIWFAKEDDLIYELALYDSYAELYKKGSADDEKKTLLANFIYIKHDGDLFTFCTLRNANMALPAVFSDLPEGISTVKVRVTFSDGTASIQYNKKSMNFYDTKVFYTKH